MLNSGKLTTIFTEQRSKFIQRVSNLVLVSRVVAFNYESLLSENFFSISKSEIYIIRKAI